MFQKRQTQNKTLGVSKKHLTTIKTFSYFEKHRQLFPWGFKKITSYINDRFYINRGYVYCFLNSYSNNCTCRNVMLSILVALVCHYKIKNEDVNRQTRKRKRIVFLIVRYFIRKALSISIICIMSINIEIDYILILLGFTWSIHIHI